MPPADSPKTVTLPGSPPKSAMWSRTQWRAATWSARPQLPEARPLPAVEPGLARVLERRVGQEPEQPETVVDGDYHDVALS